MREAAARVASRLWCGGEEKRRFSLGLTRMDGIMTGWHRLGLLEMVWIPDYVDFHLQMLEKEPSLDWFRVWVEPTEASVGLKIIDSTLVCHDNAEQPKGQTKSLSMLGPGSLTPASNH